MTAAAKRTARKIWHLNWNAYQRLKPFLLILLSMMALMTLVTFDWKFVIQIIILLWVLCLALYEFLMEAAK